MARTIESSAEFIKPCCVDLVLAWEVVFTTEFIELKKCYYDSGAAADWDSSRKFCSAHGASLAVIDNCQELNFIIYRIRTTDFWIGLYKRGNEFFWVNGESFDTDLFHVNTSDDGDCVHIDIQPLTPPEAAPHSRAGFAPLVSLIPTQTPSRAQLAM
ncbi:C-type lectin domain family 2 member L-like [Apteryx rowi]|uniref:C-type lectin domain family 2 member L-like n=1 Tax=Apteryx rowi TaxID=308060 RepID=UPI000E1D735F|nr:C-type lectin domain family 2 member L-like [Apteryx rowi]